MILINFAYLNFENNVRLYEKLVCFLRLKCQGHQQELKTKNIISRKPNLFPIYGVYGKTPEGEGCIRLLNAKF